MLQTNLLGREFTWTSAVSGHSKTQYKVAGVFIQQGIVMIVGESPLGNLNIYHAGEITLLPEK
jgi:hypothetical protein